MKTLTKINFLSGALLLVMLLVLAAMPGAVQADEPPDFDEMVQVWSFELPFQVFWGIEDSEHEILEEPKLVPEDLVGKSVWVRVRPNDLTGSPHPQTELLLGNVVVEDVESGETKYSSIPLVLGMNLNPEVRLGPEGVSSLGFIVEFYEEIPEVEAPTCVSTVIDEVEPPVGTLITIATDYTDPGGVVAEVLQKIEEVSADGKTTINTELTGVEARLRTGLVGTGTVVTYLLDEEGNVIGGGPGGACEADFATKRFLVYMPLAPAEQFEAPADIRYLVIAGDPWCQAGVLPWYSGMERFPLDQTIWIDCEYGIELTGEPVLAGIGYTVSFEFILWPHSQMTSISRVFVNGEELIPSENEWISVRLSDDATLHMLGVPECASTDNPCHAVWLLWRDSDDITGYGPETKTERSNGLSLLDGTFVSPPEYLHTVFLNK